MDRLIFINLCVTENVNNLLDNNLLKGSFPQN